MLPSKDSLVVVHATLLLSEESCIFGYVLATGLTFNIPCTASLIPRVIIYHKSFIHPLSFSLLSHSGSVIGYFTSRIASRLKAAFSPTAA